MDHRQRRNRHIPGANPSLAPHQRTLTAAAVALTRVCSNGSQGAAPWASRAASALSRLPSLAHNLSLTTHTYSSATQPPAVPEGSSVVNSVRGATALWGPQNPATALAGKMPFVCTLRITDCGDRHEPSDHSSHTCLLTYATYVFTHSNTPTVIAGTTATGTGGAGGGGYGPMVHAHSQPRRGFHKAQHATASPYNAAEQGTRATASNQDQHKGTAPAGLTRIQTGTHSDSRTRKERGQPSVSCMKATAEPKAAT